MVRINVEILNMLLIAAQAVKFLDLSRFPPRPATSIQTKLNGRRNGNMPKIGGILRHMWHNWKKKHKKNQVSRHKIVRKKKKTKKRRKSRKSTELLPERRTREQEVIFTALVRMDKNDSRIPVPFSLTSSCAASFASLEGKVLEVCGLSRKNVQFSLSAQWSLSPIVWNHMGSIYAFLKGTHRLYCFVGVGNCVKQSASIQSKEPGKSFLAAMLSSKFPRESQNLSNSVLKKIVDKEWSSVYRYGLSWRSREEAMRELVIEHLMESQCKNCPIFQTSKVAVSACPEELPDQLKKLSLTACELKKFFDKRAKERKVYGSADLLLNPYIRIYIYCIYESPWSRTPQVIILNWINVWKVVLMV